MQKRRILAIIIVLALVAVFFIIYLDNPSRESSGITTNKDTDGDGYNDDVDEFPDDPFEWKDSDKDEVGDNSDKFPYNRYEQYDSDNDGIGNNEDKFPYDSTQWLDRDGDGYGDNSDGKNADRFPDDSTEWKDSDNDNVGDNADILDSGNAGIKVQLTTYQGDYYDDDWDETDPYFKIFIYQWNTIKKEYEFIDSETSQTYEETNSVSYLLSLTVDVDDDVERIQVTIQGWDYDYWSDDDQIDLNGDSSYKVLYTYFYPKQTSYKAYTADGRLDLLDEMDGYIEYYIQVVEV